MPSLRQRTAALWRITPGGKSALADRAMPGTRHRAATALLTLMKKRRWK